MSVQTLAFSFVVLRLGESAYTFVRISTHWLPFCCNFELQIASDSEPTLVLNRHCDICEFNQHCRAKAVEADNLTLLSGMTLKEMVRHNSKGIFSVKQLSYTFRPRRPAKRQKQQFHHNFALQALALREKKVHVLGDPILTLPRTQVYLDIEGLPDRGNLLSHRSAHRDGSIATVPLLLG